MAAFVAEKWTALRGRLSVMTGAQWFLVLLVVLLLVYAYVLLGAPRAGGGGR